MNRMPADLVLEPLDERFSVCKVTDYSGISAGQRYCFTGSTDTENSLVCRTEDVPDNTTAREDGWRCFRIRGELAFYLTGILAGIAGILAEHDISIPADLEASAIRDAIAGLEAEPDRDAPVVGWTEYAAFYEELRGLVKAYDQITP